MDDASLDDFLDGGESSDEADVDGADVHEADVDEVDADADAVVDDGVDETTDGDVDDAKPTSSAEADEDAVEPPRSTMTFSPDPGECGVCGEPAIRRWTDGDALVCRECKEW